MHDNAQVAQLRVEEMNENMEEFCEEAEEVGEVGSKPGNVSKFNNEVEASLSAQGIWDDEVSEMKHLRPVDLKMMMRGGL